MLIRKNGDDINVIIGQACITYTQDTLTLPRVFTDEIVINNVIVVVDSLRTNKITLQGDAQLTILNLRSRKIPQLYFENVTEDTRLVIENNIIDISSFNYNANTPKKSLKPYERLMKDSRVVGDPLEEETLLVPEETEIRSIGTSSKNEFVVRSTNGNIGLTEDDIPVGMTATKL